MRTLHWMFLAFVATGCLEPDAVETNVTEEELDVSQWADDVRIRNQSTSRQPGLAQFGDHLYMVHNGNSTPSELYWSRFDGTSWSPDVRIPYLRPDGGPALVVWQNQLRMIYRAASQNKLVMSTWNGSSWGNPVDVGTSRGSNRRVTSAPSVVVHEDDLYVAYCESRDGGQYAHVDVTTNAGIWFHAGDFRLPGGSWNCKHVAIGTSENRLHLYWTRMIDGLLRDDWALDYAYTDAHIVDPYGWDTRGTGWLSVKPMSMVRCNDYTHFVHGGHGSPREIWWSYVSYAYPGGWAPDARVRNQWSNAGAALGCYNDRLIMVHNGNDENDLWWSEFH